MAKEFSAKAPKIDQIYVRLWYTVWTSKFVRWKPPVEPPQGGFLPQKVEPPQHAISYQVGGFHFFR